MKLNRTLWTMQGLLAALFVFAGVMKLVLPIEAMAGPVALPGALLRFVGVAELLGGIGLVLPWLLKIRPVLTPVAAGGLVIIMIGAVVLTAPTAGVAGATFPFLVGAALIAVGYGRLQAPAV
ncbi:MAG TPA: DoxX family protein [Vicinamibacterales bacterium]|nr:DoxX family protein [Vicinamibacterales bacterium]